MKSPDQRIAELERQVAQLSREVAAVRKPAREAAPLAPRKGWFLGITREDFTKNSSGSNTYSLDVWIWSATLTQWRQVPGLVIEARDWFLPEDETVPKKTKVKFEWYETTWVVTGIYCSPIDEESSGYSPGGESTGSTGSFDMGSYGGGSGSYATTYDAGALLWQD